MPDISMCKGGECPFKEKCYRHTANPSENQYWFFSTPYDPKKRKCEHYWEDKTVKQNPNTK